MGWRCFWELTFALPKVFPLNIWLLLFKFIHVLSLPLFLSCTFHNLTYCNYDYTCKSHTMLRLCYFIVLCLWKVLDAVASCLAGKSSYGFHPPPPPFFRERKWKLISTYLMLSFQFLLLVYAFSQGHNTVGSFFVNSTGKKRLVTQYKNLVFACLSELDGVFWAC